MLSREQARVRELGVALAVPPFAALRAVQDKIAARGTLIEHGVPQPEATVVHSGAELLDAAERLPAYVKSPIGTASSGVTHVTDLDALDRLARRLEAEERFADGGVLVQQPVAGPLAMVQAVFDSGRLVAAHANLRARLGVNGGASAKRSLALGVTEQHHERLGQALGWHGALSLDVVLASEGPRYIDVNPRLVEPGNAWRAGTDLVEALLRVSRAEPPQRLPPGRAGVRTHQQLLAVLAAGQHTGRRRAVLAELVTAAARRGPYRDSTEELTPLRRDPLAAVPLAAASVSLLAAPRLWRRFAEGAVADYALTPAAWHRICAPTTLDTRADR